MSEDTPSEAPTKERLDALIAGYMREKAAMADQRKEIALLIKQAVAEIDRLSQRNREFSSQMRQIQTNIEAFSRAEIQQRYAAYQEAQMRLFMMQSQLEQLRSRQTNLEKTEELLNGFLEAASYWTSSLNEESESSAPKPLPALTEGSGAADALPSIETAYHRISRELQDAQEQAFSDLLLRAEVCERLVRVDIQKAREEMGGLKQAATAALKSTRQLVHELQPPALEELGLVSALRRYVEVSRPSNRLRIELQLSGQERRLVPDTELAVFRIVQEALLNASLHSGADRAEVKLRFEPEQVVITVADQGSGFNVDAVLAESSHRVHSGLVDMQLRSKLIGATLEVGSKIGGGCMVSLVVPA